MSLFFLLFKVDETSASANCLGFFISSTNCVSIFIRIHKILCDFLSRNGAVGKVSNVPPSTYTISLYLYDENMNGTAILMHMASMTFISGCVYFEKYSVLDVFTQKADIYKVLSISENVGSDSNKLTNC